MTLEPLEGVLGEMPMVNHSPLLVIYRLRPVTEHPYLAYYIEWDILKNQNGSQTRGPLDGTKEPGIQRNGTKLHLSPPMGQPNL